jgi:hypothetical protein
MYAKGGLVVGIIPGLGDIVDAGLNYGLVVRPANKLDIPKDLLSKMLLNNAVSAGLGWVLPSIPTMKADTDSGSYRCLVISD